MGVLPLKRQLIILAVLLIATATEAQVAYKVAGAAIYGYDVSAYHLTGDSTLMFAPANNYIVTGVAVIVDTAWRASDSLKVGIGGYSGTRPGNLFAQDTAFFNTTHAKTWYYRECWQGAKRGVYLYHDGLGADRQGKVRVYVWVQPTDADSASQFLPMGYWNDLIGTANTLRQNPLTAYPEYDYTSLGYRFRNAQSDTLYILLQMDHGLVNGTGLHPYVHWEQIDTGKVVWKIKYRMSNPGGVPSAWADTSGYLPEFAYASGTKHQITETSTLPGLIGGEIPIGLSCIIEVKLIRLGTHPQDTYPKDVLLKAFDIHYMRWKPGTLNEYGDD